MHMILQWTGSDATPNNGLALYGWALDLHVPSSPPSHHAYLVVCHGCTGAMLIFLYCSNFSICTAKVSTCYLVFVFCDKAMIDHYIWSRQSVVLPENQNWWPCFDCGPQFWLSGKPRIAWVGCNGKFWFAVKGVWEWEEGACKAKVCLPDVKPRFGMMSELALFPSLSFSQCFFKSLVTVLLLHLFLSRPLWKHFFSSNYLCFKYCYSLGVLNSSCYYYQFISASACLLPLNCCEQQLFYFYFQFLIWALFSLCSK